MISEVFWSYAQHGVFTCMDPKRYMDIAFIKLCSRLFLEKDMRILMVGLNGVGKTTILEKLELRENLSTIPTMVTSMVLEVDTCIAGLLNS